jgi:Domain of unknown function (DUF3291)
MKTYQLAQLNIALMTAPINSPAMADFVANLDRINALAEHSSGYVWRLKTEDGNATALRPFGEEYLVNLSVWRDVEALYNYVYKSAHVEIMKRRKEWFERMRESYSVLWWVPQGHRPTTAEAKVRLQCLNEKGPTLEAFTFKNPYPAPGSIIGGALVGLDDLCPAT